MARLPTRALSAGLALRAGVVSGVLTLLAMVLVLNGVATSSRRSAHESAQQALNQSADLVSLFLSGRERTLMGGARVFVQYSPFRATITSGPREDVLDQAIGAVEQIAADWVFITNANGVLIAKSDEPAVFGVPMGQVPLVAGALGGLEQRGFGASGDTMLFQAVALPISAHAGAPSGVLVATVVIDSTFLHDVKTATSSDLLFYTRDEQGHEHPAASTVPGSARELTTLLTSRTALTPDAPTALTLGPERYQWVGTALSTAGGKVVGGFLVMRKDTDATNGVAALNMPIAIAVVASCFAALLCSWLTARYVARPARQMASTISGIANDTLETPVTPSGIRELHELSAAVRDVRNEFRNRRALMVASRSVVAGVTPPQSRDGLERALRSARTVTRTGAGSALMARQISRPDLVLAAGSILANRYFIEAEVGRGGLGIVYRALDRVLNETVAIKVLRPELALSDGGGFEEFRNRLRHLRDLTHRNIVRVHDIGQSDDAPFLSSEFIEGPSLATVIAARGALTPDAAFAVARQLFTALATAHEQGVIHGDLKPANVLIAADGLLKVSDFGVARLIRRSKSPHARPDVARTATATTRLTGAVIGNPEYMAPEQLIGEPSTIASDLYAAGLVLRDCLTGIAAPHADTPVEFVARKLGANQTAPSEVNAASIQDTHHVAVARIGHLIEQLTHPRPEMRPRSAKEALTQIGEQE